MTSVLGSLPRPRARTHKVASIELAAGAALILIIGAAALFGPFVQTHDPAEGNLLNRFVASGSAGHLLGTDHLGRDIWSRLVAGLQWSMACALTVNVMNLFIGATLGMLAAERPGPVRTFVRLVTDTIQSFPSLVVAIVVVVIVGHGFVPLVLTLGLLGWPVFMRVAYAEATSIYTHDYVKAARIAGVSRFATLFGHVLPGLRSSLMVVFAFHFATLLTTESALSFLGLGAPIGVPTWGNMLAESRQFLLTRPGMLFVPATAIIVTVIAANLLGDGLAARARKLGKGTEA